jgi:hypothetical protein
MHIYNLQRNPLYLKLNGLNLQDHDDIKNVISARRIGSLLTRKTREKPSPYKVYELGRLVYREG